MATFALDCLTHLTRTELDKTLGQPEPDYGYVIHDVLSEIEAKLFSGEVYAQAIANLSAQFGETTKEIRESLELLGREAIRLAAQQFSQVSQGDKTGQMASPQCSVAETKLSSVVVERQGTIAGPIEVAPEQPEKLMPAIITAEPVAQTTTTKPMRLGKKIKPTAAELAAQREDYLRQVGQKLAELRRLKGLSIDQLHEKTHIPLHQLKALEAGQANRLPETIYVRGFIRQIAAALGADGTELANSLPLTEPNEGILPSWGQSSRQSSSKFYFNAVHLYVGYGALMASAIGGLNYLANQSASSLNPSPEPILPEQPTAAQATHSNVTSCKAGLQTAQQSGIAGPEIALPETLPAFSNC